ncbi:LAMI_0D05666g1_1 [Lachancea mirantina]|uniref:LAMI_0D05666g1_1 n=1 Tax=Lachancea mirantina TaxID=1230905 RepID=A0A1G4JBA2_9SACH|nr:LAMI_0D05666g1_1 [Lachancea mirantina]
MDESSTKSLISDSEVEECETIYWNAQNNYSIAESFLPLGSVGDEESSVVSSTVVNNAIYDKKTRRRLRERTAIQRNPYKIDKLNYKFLFDGLDATNNEGCKRSARKDSSAKSKQDVDVSQNLLEDTQDWLDFSVSSDESFRTDFSVDGRFSGDEAEKTGYETSSTIPSIARNTKVASSNDFQKPGTIHPSSQLVVDHVNLFSGASRPKKDALDRLNITDRHSEPIGQNEETHDENLFISRPDIEVISDSEPFSNATEAKEVSHEINFMLDRPKRKHETARRLRRRYHREKQSNIVNSLARTKKKPGSHQIKQRSAGTRSNFGLTNPKRTIKRVKTQRSERSRETSGRKNKESLQHYFKPVPALTLQASEITQHTNKRNRQFFETVVENEASEFTVLHSNERAYPEDTRFHTPSRSKSRSDSIIPIIISIVNDEPLDPCQSFTASLSGKRYTVSKFSPICIQEIRQIFEHIIKLGASEIEILKLARFLLLFCNLCDLPDLKNAVESFHIEFRSKVNSLRDRAKAVHFYQIAICQVLLFQVSKFNNIPSSVRQELQSKIIDNTVACVRLLSKCYAKATADDISLLKDSMQMLGILLTKQQLTISFWERLSAFSLQSELLLFTLEMFPVHHTFWNALDIGGNSFNSMSSNILFVESALNTHLWKADDYLLLRLYELFKRRKFTDFEEERSKMSSDAAIISSHLDVGPATLFNRFLAIVSTSNLSQAMIEKMTPLSELTTHDSETLLVNRINLLIVLARKSRKSHEKQLESLVSPFLAGDKQPRMTERSFISILSGVSSLLELNSSRDVPFKGRILVSLCQVTVKAHRPGLDNQWNSFLTQIPSFVEKMGKTKGVFLKGCFPTLTCMIEDRTRFVTLTSIFSLYANNVESLEAPWVQTHLYQFLITNAPKDVRLLDPCCKVMNYLVGENRLTWWSILSYNPFGEQDDIKLQFLTKLLTYCGRTVFEQIKFALYQVVVELLLRRADSLFVKYLLSLAGKDENFKPQIYGFSFVGHVELICKVLRAFEAAGYVNLIKDCVKNLKVDFLQQPNKRDLHARIMEFINSGFFDKVKAEDDFLYLKEQFNISNVETEKSAFRELLRMKTNDFERAFLVQDRLVQSFKNRGNFLAFVDALKCSFAQNVYENDITFICSLIQVNAMINWNTRSDINWALLSVLVGIINKMMGDQCCQVSPSEFLPLIQLHQLLCHGFSRTLVIRKNSLILNFWVEMCTFMRRILMLASGFAEYDSLIEDTRLFLSRPVAEASFWQKMTSPLFISAKVTLKHAEKLDPGACIEKTPEHVLRDKTDALISQLKVLTSYRH